MTATPTPREVVARDLCRQENAHLIVGHCVAAHECHGEDCIYGERADAILAALAAAGYAVVPREPTEAMVNAALDRKHGEDLPLIYHGIWRAMVAAAEVPRDGE